MATTATMPLNANFPTFQGFSSAFIILGILLVYQVLSRPGILFRTARHAVFLAGYAFIGLSLIMEIMHENPAFYGIFQIGFMLAGAVLVSSLCRDRRAFYSGLYGYILGCVILTAIVVLTTYGKVSSVSVTGDFSSTSSLRLNAFYDSPLYDNINGMAFFASQGALLTLIFVLNSTKRLQKFILLGISVLCMVGIFVTMSRSGLTIFVLASAAVFNTYGIIRPRFIISQWCLY